MSNLIADATVRILPDVTKFRSVLETELLAVTRKPIPVPVTPVLAPVGGAGLAALTASTASATTAIERQNDALRRQGVTSAQTRVETTKFIQTQHELQKGVVASAAGLTGLRGAVLAASAPFLLATVGITTFSRAVQAAADLETNLNVFRVTAKATAEEMEEVRKEAELLGRDLSLPGVTASDAAETFLTLSRAGLSVQDSLEGAKGTLQLAVAAQISFADAAQLTASALNAFALGGEEAVAVADTLTNAANASQASISEMGIALRQSAAIADLAGFSFSETATFLTQLAKQGLIGSDAGTSFRVSIQRLIAPTEQAGKKLKELQINLRDTQGNLRPEAFFELGTALERMGRAQADATRQLIFGNDASRAAAFLARLNAESFRDQERLLNRQGAAAEVAGARNEGFAGKVENLKNQITALGLEIGDLAIPPLGIAVDGLSLVFGTLATQISDSADAIGGFADDAEKLQVFLKETSAESGFLDFWKESDRVVGDFIDTVDRVTGLNSLENFFRNIGGGAREAVTGIDNLANEENRLSDAIDRGTDSLNEQVQSLQSTQTAAQEAAGAIGRLTGQIAGLEEGVTRARIGGDQGAELDLLEQERARLRRLLAIEEGIVSEGGRGAATARRRIREEILPQLEGVTNEIERIIDQQASDAKTLADAAQRARDERDRNILEAIGAREQRAQNAVLIAEGTESVKDDLKANIALRAVFRAALREIRKTVQDAQAKAQAIAGLTRDLIQVNEEIRRTRQALREQIREERRAERERQRESLSLDVQIAQATGNRSAEEKARQAEIKFLQRQIRQTREGSNQRKRLILELRQAQKELRELKGEREKASNAFNELTFQFLQTQQGFAANLFGNLIPGGATGGLVGNISQAAGTTGLGVPQFNEDPTRGLDAAGQIGAGRDRGVSSGQGSTQIQLLRAILRALQSLNGRAGHPEARYNRDVVNAVMDGPGV